MTEKRSDYRKKHTKKKRGHVFDKFKSAFNDDEQEDVDVNSDFQRNPEDARPLREDNEENLQRSEVDDKVPSEDKGLRLKKRLDRAILIVFILIVLVLLALFHL
ncbi:hypothetical protein [Lactobacillus acetotolerans]|uniref:Uncharacterized protein n=1 Tax=Lactobacillus acetotolerans TaxID=1600 RepID=A0A0D6A4K5_9LACO|nr:hypothetical protein [Lactobacillus acetotolerans]KRN42035.1 hypothetical protein FC77_GL000483 [Lactobacillus acetotolerans DSM 20749 = JCM 3825]QFG51412.1 hypothetical protein LA749_05145 [Lactobacillus acetotolerans]QGV04475.1 hypothetical protein GJR85_03190 [Lactobacillus acetotolerans]QJD73391.1 hypothetical protein HG715_05490 [Lactobacillus acetotolerans]BAQ57400.1 conserved hypothetical protein [Lactobacillus acetotolerans]